MKLLVSLVFSRGLPMQVAKEHDGEVRAAFSMMAFSPTRVKKPFIQEFLKAFVKKIYEATGILLEIVNFYV